MTKTCGSEFSILLWRHLTPQRKTAIWMHSNSPSVHNSPKDILENVLPVWRLLFVANHFWTTYRKFDNCCQRHAATCGKIYIGAHLHSQPKLQWWNLLKFLSYLYEVVRTTFFAHFWPFRNFRPQFHEICGAIWQRKLGVFIPLKG